jgi:hypothetical protein
MNKFKLAQKRNYFKFVVTGIPKPIDKSVLSELEIQEWDSILEARNIILKYFDDASKRAGLNVIKPCWCGKRRKTECGEQNCMVNLKWDELKNHFKNGGKVIWEDLDPIEGNDYVLSYLQDYFIDSYVPITIQYNNGKSEAQVYFHELKIIK